MRDKRLYFFSGILFTAVFSFLFTTCEVGLGEAVDIAPPTLTITYPPASSVIRDNFVLAGVCKDDVTVESVVVTVRNTDRGENFGPYNATLSGDAWQVNLNGSGNYNGWLMSDGRYVAEVYANDAAGRKSGVASIPFDIDNTAPLFVLSSPGNDVMDEGTATKFGSRFKLAGTIAEDHTVSKVKIKVYDTNGTLKGEFSRSNIEIAGGSEIAFAEKGNTADHDDDGHTLDENYKTIYGDYNTESGAKLFKCTIEVSDSAKKYTRSDSDSSDGGNKTNEIYFYDDVYNAWLSVQSGLDASKAKKIINGTYTEGFAAGSFTTPQLNNDGTVNRDRDSNGFYSLTHSSGEEAFNYVLENLPREEITFSLNPDADPTYTVIGYTKPKYQVLNYASLNTEEAKQQFTTAFSSQQITVQALCGLNGYGVVPSSIQVYQFGPYDLNEITDSLINEIYTNIYPTDADKENNVTDTYHNANPDAAAGDATERSVNVSSYYIAQRDDGKAILIGSLDYSGESSAETYSTAVTLDGSITGNKFYLIVVTGVDSEQQKLKPSAGNICIFKGELAGTPPTVVINDHNSSDPKTVTPNDQAVVKTADFSLAGTIVEGSSSPTMKFSVTVSEAESGDFVGYFEKELTYSNATNPKSWSFNIKDASGFINTPANNYYLYDVIVHAENLGGGVDKERKIFVDTIDPVVTITSVNPEVSKENDTTKYVNGTFKVTGKAEDTNLETVWYEIKSNDGTNEVTLDSRTLTPKAEGQWYSFNNEITIDSTDVAKFKTHDNTPVEIIVYARDRGGNVGSKSTTVYNNGSSYKVDQSTDKPRVKGSNFCLVTDVENLCSDADFDNGKGNIFDKTSNHKLIGMVEDDDGIESVQIVRVQVNESGESVSGQTPVTESVSGVSRGTTAASFTYTGLPTDAGIYQIQVIATDITWNDDLPDGIKANRQTTYGPFYVAVDNNNPVLSETLIGTEDLQYIRHDDPATPAVNEATITFGGTVSDDWKMNSVKVSVYSSETLSGEKTLRTSDVEIPFAADGSWTHTPNLATNPEDGSPLPSEYYTFVFTARDKADKTTTVTRKVLKDIDPPVFGTQDITLIGTSHPDYSEAKVKPYIKTAMTNGWYNTTTLSVAGGVSDNASGVKKVEYSLDGNTWIELSGTSSFGGTIANVTNGAVIHLRATDVAGNVATTRIEGILIDTGVPSGVVTKIDGKTEGIGNILSNKQNPIQLEGTAEDALSGISQILISLGDKDFTSTGKPDVTVDPSAIIVDSTDPTKYTWSATIPASKITKTGTVWALIKDGAGNTSELNLFSLQVDDEDPEIDFNASLKESTVNKMINITGTANDNQKLDVVKLEYQSGVTGTGTSAVPVWTELTSDGTPAATATDSKKVSGTYNWKLENVDTEKAFGTTIYDCDSTKAGTQVKFRATAIDAAGNKKISETYITVDQNTDRPVITFTNLNPLDGMAPDNYLFFNNTKMMGNLTDDDGIDNRVIFKIVTRQVSASATAPTLDEFRSSLVPVVTLTSGSWNYTFTNQGKQDVYFYVKDSKGTEFISKVSGNAYDSVYLKDETNTFGTEQENHVSTVLYIRIDTVDPEQKNLAFNFYSKKDNAYIKGMDAADWSDTVADKILGGNTSKFAIRLDATDANGIRSVKGKLGNEELTFEKKSVDGEKNGTYILKDILLGNTATTGNLKDGVNYFTIEVTDNAGRSRSTTLTLNIDNTLPIVKVSNPASNKTVSGNVNAYGTVDENCDMYYAISPSGTISPDDNETEITSYQKTTGEPVTIADVKDKVNYTDMLGAGLTWYVYFDGDSDPSQTVAHDARTLNKYLVHYGITTDEAIEDKDNPFDTIVKLFFWVKAVDKAGNVTEVAHEIKLDPQGDRPTVTVNYPEKDGDTLGGTIKVYGEASDNIAVESVWLQVMSKKNHPDDWSTYVTYTAEDANPPYSVTKFEPTVADLNFLAEQGYAVYNKTKYNPESGSNQIWKSGQSTIDTGCTPSDYGILANASGSTWNVKLNVKDELNPASGDSNANVIVVRAYARDGDGKESIPADRIFKIDSDKPIFASTQPFYVVKSADVSYNSSSTASRAYADDMYLKGEWYLIGSVEDDVGIKSLTLKDNNSGTTKVLIDNETAKTGTDFDVVISGKVAYFKIKLPTSNGVGSLDYLLTAEDIAEGQSHAQTKDVKINYDNNSPHLIPATANGYNINPSVKQGNNFYVFGSAVKEDAVTVGSKTVNQSGFDYVAFFFMRRADKTTDSKNYIYDVMQPRKILNASDELVANPANKVEVTSSLAYEEGLYWKQITVTRDESNLKLLKLSAKDENIHAGGLVKIGGATYLIKEVSSDGKNITIDGEPLKEFTAAKFAYANVVNNTVQETDFGTIQDDGYYLKPANDDGDRMIESVSKTGTTWTWEADICSKNIPDGPIELHYVAFDKAGNFNIGIMGCVSETDYKKYTTADAKNLSTNPVSVYAYNSETPGFVSNNQPRIAGVIFGTDDNANGVVDPIVRDANGNIVSNGEMNISYGGWYNVDDPYGNKIAGVNVNGTQVNGSAVTSFNIPKDLDYATLTIKGSTKIIPEIVGGNNGLKYTYHVTKNGETTPYFNSNSIELSSTDSATDEIRENTEINLSTVNLLTEVSGKKIQDGQLQKFAFKIWDKTEGTVAGSTSQFATINLVANVVLNDSEKARVWFKPFYWRWNDSTRSIENSIYYENAGGKSLPRGHIELEKDWKQTAGTDGAYLETATSGVRDADPKVSGIISMRGTANDNVCVNELWIKVPGFREGTDDSANRNHLRIAHRDATTGMWTSDGTLGTDGWEFALDGDEVFDQVNGNTVNFVFTWNTAKLATIAKPDVVVEIMAKDKGSISLGNGNTLVYTTTGPSAAGTAQTTEGSKTCYYKMDVVPYITGVTTSLSDLKKNNSSVYARTAFGHYPVRANETVTISGYNLAADSADVTLDISTLTTSGKYVHTISYTGGSVSSLNNINYNNACGTYPSTGSTTSVRTYSDNDFAYCYNRQPNGDNNNLLTDDVEFDIWLFKDAAISQTSGYITEPIMKVNPKNGILNFGFNSGPANYCMGDGQTYSYKTWVGNYARFSTCGFNVDENGVTHGISVGLDTNPGDSHSAGRMQYFTSKWGRSDLNTNGNYEGKNSSRFENIGAPPGTYNGNAFTDYAFIEDRFASPSLATAVHGNDTYVFLAYYDDLNCEVRFRWGNLSQTYVGTNTNTSNAAGQTGITFGQFSDQRKYNLYGGGTINNNTHTAFDSNTKSEYFSTIASSSTTAKAGNYVSIDVIKGTSAATDVIVATWYDATASKWWYSYMKNPYGGTTDSTKDNYDMEASPSATPADGKWRKPIELKSNAGENCQITVDKAGGIHIASYDGENADLIYAYLSSYDDTTPQVVTVDSYAFTGTNIRLDTVVSDDGNYIIPYIGYYMSSVQRTKMACLKDVISSSATKADREAVNVPGGVNSSEQFTGTWETTIIPSTSRYADNYAYSYVNVGLWKDATTGKAKVMAGTDVGYSNKNGLTQENTSKTYGNGTANPVLGYATRVGTRGHIETAQMK